jgi:hypothetical protein
MGSQLARARATGVVVRAKPALSIAPLQLDLVLDDVCLQGMTVAERHAALKALAQLFLEASGAVTTGGADDDA